MKCEFDEWDGAYVLGALDPDDLRTYEAHLASCAQCRTAVDELRPSVGQLAAARSAGITPDEQPVPDTLLPGLLRLAGRERRRQRTVVAAIATLAAACLVALVVVVWPSSGSTTPKPRALHELLPSPVSATAQLVARPWGTEVHLRCRYYEHVERGISYGLRLVDTDNHFHEAGTWALSPDHPIDFTGGAAVPLAKVRYVQITLPDGKPILQLTA